MRYELIVNSLLSRHDRRAAKKRADLQALVPRPEAVRPPFHGSIRHPSGTRFSAARRGVYGVSLSGRRAQERAGGLAEPKPARDAGRKCRHRVTICLHIAKQLRLVALMGHASGGTGVNTKRGVGDVLGGDGSQRRRFCGETASARQAFTALGLVRTTGQMLQKATDPEISGW